MADEQPGHIARGVRDVSKVPLAKELVKNNVGSTVKNQEQTAQFAIVSQARTTRLYVCCTQDYIYAALRATAACALHFGGNAVVFVP